MRTIAIMNNKGGVGKTVTAINVADLLVREHGKTVVIADCDGQKNLTDFYDLLVQKRSLTDFRAIRDVDVLLVDDIHNLAGKKQIQELFIDSDIVDPDDTETLADVLTAAFNEAIRTVEDTNQTEMEKITGSINMPGLF